jgi:hypothetical protein
MPIRFRFVTGLAVAILAGAGLLLASGPGGASAQLTTPTPTLPAPTLGPADYEATIDAQQRLIDALEATVTAQAMTLSAVKLPTIDPALLPAVATGTPAPTLAGDGCVEHVIQSGDTVYALAQDYGVSWRDVLQINGIDDSTILQIDDVLIIPLGDCVPDTPTPSAPGPTLAATPTVEALGPPTSTPFDLAQDLPTFTPVPTAITVQVIIAKVANWGNANTEAVEIVNQGDVLNLQGWTLSNASGAVFLFPEFRFSPGSAIQVFSRPGTNTPAALFWGRDTAAWAAGDTLTLADSTGQVRATFQIEAAPPPAG